MWIFGKKEPEEPELEEKRRLPSAKKFKDLKPENKRKRKEPVKPWTKRERFFVLGVIGFTIIIPSVLALAARDWKLPGLPRISIPKLEFNQTIVIEGRKGDNSLASLADQFSVSTKPLSGTYGLYVYDLEKDVSAGVYESDKFQAASLIKLPVMIALYMEEEKGNISLETKYTLRESDKVGGSGSLSSKPAGTKLSLRELIRYMGKESDNTAFRISRNILGDEKINEVIAKIGMTQTDLEENETSPYDIGLLFERLWKDELISKENKNELLSFLTNTIYEDHLAKGIPEGIPIAHKYGRELHVVNDAGIVMGDNPYIIVIITKGVVESQADEIFPVLSRDIYDYLVK